FICCAYIHSEVESVVLQRWADPVTAVELGPVLGPRMFDLADLGRLMGRIAAKVQVVACDALRGSVDGYRELLEQGAVMSVQSQHGRLSSINFQGEGLGRLPASDLTDIRAQVMPSRASAIAMPTSESKVARPDQLAQPSPSQRLRRPS